MEKNPELEKSISSILHSANTREQAISEIVDFIEKERNKLTTIDITDRLELYVNDKVKSFWKEIKVGEGIEVDSNRDVITALGLKYCFMGMVVERSVAESFKEIDEYVTEEEYQVFASFLNKAADLDLIEYGVLAFSPIKMGLAIISASRRTMLLFYSFSKKSSKELKEISNFFVNEGELPNMMQDIKFNA